MCGSEGERVGFIHGWGTLNLLSVVEGVCVFHVVTPLPSICSFCLGGIQWVVVMGECVLHVVTLLSSAAPVSL